MSGSGGHTFQSVQFEGGIVARVWFPGSLPGESRERRESGPGMPPKKPSSEIFQGRTDRGRTGSRVSYPKRPGTRAPSAARGIQPSSLRSEGNHGAADRWIGCAVPPGTRRPAPIRSCRARSANYRWRRFGSSSAVFLPRADWMPSVLFTSAPGVGAGRSGGADEAGVTCPRLVFGVLGFDISTSNLEGAIPVPWPKSSATAVRSPQTSAGRAVPGHVLRS